MVSASGPNRRTAYRPYRLRERAGLPRSRYLSLLTLVALLVVGCGAGAVAPSNATTVSNRSYTLRWSTQWGTDFPAVRADKSLIKAIENKSHGQIKFNLFLNGSLGGATGAVTGVENGTIQIADLANSYFSSISPHSNAFTLPFLFKTGTDGQKALQGPAGQVVSKELLARGIKPLALYGGNFSYEDICNNVRPLKSPNDLRGLKIRTLPTPVTLDEMRALGANPVAMDFTEVYTAMQSHTIDGYSAGLSAELTEKWNEVTKYCSLTNDSWSFTGVIINEKFFNNLPRNLQTVVLNAAKDYDSKVISLFNKYYSTEIKNIKNAGVKVNPVPASTRQAWTRKMSPIYAKANSQYGATFMADLRKS